MRSRFFWRLYLTYAVLVLVTGSLIGLLAHYQLRGSLLADVESGLRDAGALFAEHGGTLLARGERERAQAEVERIGTETGIRVTLVHRDGQVLADSHEDPALMENHAGRVEIRAAFRGESASVQRYSETLGREMLYLARPVRSEGRAVGVVRVALPVAEIQGMLGRQRRTILLGTLVGMVVALAVGLLVAGRITAPITHMTQVAEELRAGDYERRIRQLPDNEIGTLGATINRLVGELTERIRTLSEERARVEAMVSRMREGVLAVDEDDRFIFCNRTARRWLEIGSEALAAGRDGETPALWEVVRNPGLTELLAEARRGDGTARAELRILRDPGELLIDAHATAFEGGGAEGIVVVLHDITELRRLERVRRDFVANVSHELKTPLTSIRGYVETLLGGALRDEEVNERFLRRIAEQVRRLETLVNDLLGLARVDAAKGRLELAEVDWRPIVEEALCRVQISLESKGVDCEVEGLDRPVQVLGDPEAMRQVVDNLLDNAIKYTDAPGTIAVRLGRDDPDALLEISDTGKGIPGAQLDRVFERFYRVDPGRAPGVGGAGLGLSIVRNLVEAMRGEVSVDSRVGEGSRFTVRLPLADQ